MKKTINQLLEKILGYNPHVNTGNDIEKLYKTNWQKWNLGEEYEIFEAIYVLVNRNYALNFENQTHYNQCILENGRFVKKIKDALNTKDQQVMIEILEFKSNYPVKNTKDLLDYLKKLSVEANEQITLCIQINENYYDTYINHGIACMEYPFEIPVNNKERVLNDIYDFRFLYDNIDLDSIPEFKINLV